MAQLRDLIVNGATRLIGDVFTNKIQITAVNAPTASNGTTYGPGTSGQVLKSNGTSVYWDSQAVTGVKGNSESSYRTGNVNITAANIGLGNVENTKLSTWAGSANITTLGTISSGTWNGTAITATYGGTGKTNLKDAANALINALDTGSSNLTANDYVITQYVGGGTTTTTYHRRPASALRVGGVLVTSTDEGIARYNGTTGALQNTSQITINDNGLLTATHTNGKTDGIAIKYGSTIDYFLGVGTANVNHGLYDNKAGQWILSAGADNIWSLAGNAATATSASSVALSGVTGADDLKAIEALSGTSGLLKKTAANTWTLDTTAYTTNTGTVTTVTAGTGLNTSADQTDSATKGSITTTGTLYLTKSGATAGSYGPSAAVTGSHGTTMNVPYVTVDAYGRVTSISNKVYTAQNTWRGIQDNLTSSSNTTESLSAKQGYLLANGDARDDTKVLKTGDTMSGQLIVEYDNTSDTEYPIVVQRNKAGTSNAGVAVQVKNSGSGLSVSPMIGAGGSNHGLWSSGYYNGTTYTTDGKWIVYRNNTGAITLNGNAATATKLATSRTLWGQSFNGSADITGNLISPSTGTSWLDGQRYTRGAYNVGDATNSDSYWPWMRQTNTSSAKWFSFGTLGTKFYWIGSDTSRTANSYDYGMTYDVASGRFYSYILNTSRRGTGTPSGGADGDIYFQYS